MDARKRILSVLAGETPDHTPVYTCIPFGVNEQGLQPAAFTGYLESDPWRSEDPAYRRLLARMTAECDNLFFWQPGCMRAEQTMLTPSLIDTYLPAQKDGRIYIRKQLTWKEKTLSNVTAVQPGTGHSWQIEPWCKDIEDARLVLELPFQPRTVDLERYRPIEQALGAMGVMVTSIYSPLLPVVRLFDPTDFMMLLRTEADTIAQLLKLSFQRIKPNLDRLLELGVGPIIRFGGAEHATPPLMSPEDFDNYVVEFDAPLVDACKAHGHYVAYHCHGHLRHALARLREMGVDMVDPVETDPDGDISLEEARSIAGPDMTLVGNLQMREITTGEAVQIEARVRGIFAAWGPTRLIISTTGAPLERIPGKMEENYYRMIDTALHCRHWR